MRTLGDVATLLGVTRDTVRKDFPARGMPVLPCAAPLLVQWRVRDLLRKPTARDESGDSMLDGEESEGLERYRIAKAQLAELELAKKKCNVYDTEIITRGHGLMIHALTGAVTQLERKFGADAAEVVRSALSEVEREARKMASVADSGSAELVAGDRETSGDSAGATPSDDS